MRSAIAHRLALALVLALAATATAGGPDDSWLPAKEGAKWSYELRKVARVAGLARAKKVGTATCVCRGVEKVGDKECAVLEWTGDGDDAPSLKVWVQGGDASVTVLKATSHDLLVVPADVKEKRRKVEVATDKEKVQVESETVATDEEVTTPAGTWKCLKVTATCSMTGSVTIKRSVWYAKGVGVVKVTKEAAVGGGVSADRELVLTSFDRGEKK